MAIYHCSIKNISRSSGRSAVAASAYRAGEKLEDQETGLIHNYTNKSEIAYSKIFLCKNAPEEYHNREVLWNAVEKIEKQSNARLAREWEVALPNELTLEQSKQLVRAFSQSLTFEGMCVDANIHWKEGNHHAHILGTTRPIEADGQWGKKEKKAYALDEHGQKIPQIDHATGKQKIGARGRKIWERVTVEANNWNKPEKVEEWRKRWANQCNHYLEQEHQIDHRSLERQEIERIPTVHEGYAARQMEKRGKAAERCEINRNIAEVNRQLDTLTRQQALFVRLSMMRKKEENEEYGRLQFGITRTNDESAGRDADKDRELQAEDIRKQYSMLRSYRASGTVSFEDERSAGRVKTVARKRKLEREEDEQLDF